MLWSIITELRLRLQRNLSGNSYGDEAWGASLVIEIL